MICLSRPCLEQVGHGIFVDYLKAPLYIHVVERRSSASLRSSLVDRLWTPIPHTSMTIQTEDPFGMICLRAFLDAYPHALLWHKSTPSLCISARETIHKVSHSCNPFRCTRSQRLISMSSRLSQGPSKAPAPLGQGTCNYQTVHLQVLPQQVPNQAIRRRPHSKVLCQRSGMDRCIFPFRQCLFW